MDDTYKIVGYQYGTFNGSRGESVKYANLYCAQDFRGESNADYCFDGVKAFVFKCVSAEVLEDVEVGGEARVYFNKYDKVSLVQMI